MSKKITIQLTEEAFKKLGTLVELGQVVIEHKKDEEHSPFHEIWEEYYEEKIEETITYEEVVGDLITYGEEEDLEWAEKEELEEMKKNLLEALDYQKVGQHTAHYKAWKKEREEFREKMYNRFNNIPSPEVFTTYRSPEEMQRLLNEQELEELED